MKIKKLFLFLVIFNISLIFFCFVFAQEKVEINFFYSSGCPHCLVEQKFLDEVEKKYPEIIINSYLISDPQSSEILKQLCKQCDAENYIGLVPMTFIDGEFFLGFDTAEGMGKKIENCIKKHLGIEDLEKGPPQIDEKINLPILGEVDFKNFSLPALAIILGFLDGFNVCSLGALVLILGLVLAFRSRKRILLFGGIFIFTTAIVYGLLMEVWFVLFSLMASYLRIMQILIGIIAIGGGIYFFRQYLKFRKGAPGCEMGAGEKITSKFAKNIQESFKKPKNILLAIGTIFTFAVLITIIEFPCSGAVPAVYAGILAQAQLSGFQHLFYLALFIIFYLLNEIIIFLVALLTMRLWLASGKFLSYLILTEAIILFLLGIYYLFGFKFI